MKKVAIILAAFAVVAMVGSVAMAQSIMFLDSRSNAAGGSLNDIENPPAQTAVFNNPFIVGPIDLPAGPAGGGPGNGQVARISPKFGGGLHLSPAYPNLDGDTDLSTADLNVFVESKRNAPDT